MSLLSNAKNYLGAVALSTLALGGCADFDNNNVNNPTTPQETIDQISQKMADFCNGGPSDVDGITCTLRRNEAVQGVLYLGCGSGIGWQTDIPELFTENSHLSEAPISFDELDIKSDCTIEAADY